MIDLRYVQCVFRMQLKAFNNLLGAQGEMIRQMVFGRHYGHVYATFGGVLIVVAKIKIFVF